MNKTKKYISLIIEILLMFSIIIAVLSIFLKDVVLNKNIYLNILSTNGTYEQVKESVYNKIDKVLGSKNINNDIKESILTEEDIKKEADIAITGLIQYLKTGENNIIPIDTDVYKQRVADVLNTIVDNIVNPPKNDLSFNDNIQPTNLTYTENQLQFDNMVLVKDQSQFGQGSISMEKLMTSSEAEAKIRSLLKEKGLTEAQARQKMTEKGITKEQALAILAGYGISIDDESKSAENETSSKSGISNNSQNQTSGVADNNQNQTSGISGDNQNQTSGISEDNQSKASGAPDNNQNQDSNSNVVSGQGNENANGQDNSTGASDGVSSISKLQEEIVNAIIANDGTSIEEKLNIIENKLLDEAGTRIDNEIKKINLNKLMESSKLQKVAEITSTFYKMFWLFMSLPIILILILIEVNGRKLYSSLRRIGRGFLLAGLVLFATFFGGYLARVYENININTVYFNDIIPLIAKHLLINLSIAGIITFSIGLILLIPTIKAPERK